MISLQAHDEAGTQSTEQGVTGGHCRCVFGYRELFRPNCTKVTRISFRWWGLACRRRNR